MKIKAAVESKKDPDLVIMARTDFKAVSVIEDATYRTTKYADAGFKDSIPLLGFRII